MPAEPNLADVLRERGLFNQCTDPEIDRRLSAPTTLYCGFDPSADSLHVGHLLPIMGLAWAQRLGHTPIALVGGATGRVGDPSFKDASRPMLDEAALDRNVAAVGAQLAAFLDFDADANAAKLVNNLDWIGPLSWLDVLRDIGSRVSVNRMVGMESVRQRMGRDADAHGDGISYLEFSYMILQAYDFVHLHRSLGCTLQMAGQDQWGNIVMGIELARKLDSAALAGLTLPLITKSDGTKFGKTAGGAVWLSAERTPPWDFFQFFRNTADADVARYLAYFTFLPMDEVRALTAEGGVALNAAKTRLAFEVTRTVHGDAEAEKARDAAARVFAAGGVDAGADGVPHSALAAVEAAGEALTLTDLLRAAGFAASGGEAKRHVASGAVRLDGQKQTDPRRPIEPGAEPIVLTVGKKKIHRFDVA